MADSHEPGIEEPLRRQKVRDRAFVLPLIGLVLLLPPVADIFQVEMLLGGLPFTGVYLFAVWGVLIVGAAVLARELRGELESARDLRHGAVSADKAAPRR